MVKFGFGFEGSLNLKGLLIAVDRGTEGGWTTLVDIFTQVPSRGDKVSGAELTSKADERRELKKNIRDVGSTAGFLTFC